MKLAICIENYVNYRRSLGVCFHSEKVRLHAFRKAMGNIDINRVRPKAVRQHLDGKGPVTTFWLCKYYTLAGFYKFAITHGFVTKSPLPITKPRPPAKFVPYIFSIDDVRSLLIAVDERHEEDWLIRPCTVRTLLLLLYGTGLRIGEALALNVDDVDLNNRILAVYQTKFYKNRLVPIGTDLQGLLMRYQKKHHHRSRKAGDQPFLIDRNGGRILRQTAELVYKRIREYVGLKRPPGFKFHPRLHDFRATFAVNRLVSWYRQGENVQRLLPHLATYLGHRSIRETQQYLHLTSENAQEAGLRFLKYALPREQHD